MLDEVGDYEEWGSLDSEDYNWGVYINSENNTNNKENTPGDHTWGQLQLPSTKTAEVGETTALNPVVSLTLAMGRTVGERPDMSKGMRLTAARKMLP